MTKARYKDWYKNNPMTTEQRRRGHANSAWVRRFSCEDVRPLIVCRGPIRKEAMDVFEQMGINHYGILISEKDSIIYTHALAPELRQVTPEHVHWVKDYTGATAEERAERVQQMIDICKQNDYTHVFAGYGFMAEDASFVRALEDAGLVFIGPASTVQRAAGLKDEAKRTALENDVSVTPGVNDATRRIVLAKWPTLADMRRAVKEYGLEVESRALADGTRVEDAADALLAASYKKRVDLYSIDELAAELKHHAEKILKDNPGRRLRLKAIGGGGGKGQRILGEAARVPDLVREILSEVKAGGVGDNKNMLLEMNIERTRHNEIQLIGNGEWCVALGGRDCSLQMHEQKLLEISITQEALDAAIAKATADGNQARAESLAREKTSLARMEAEAERFGAAVSLNSASTFECIVEDDRHYFMEVNTRIQVEHRVTELCYTLRFVNPDDPSDYFDVNSLVECMVLLARHGSRLPRPQRVVREVAAIEARLNATNRALQPHAGGTIVYWSDPVDHEIRDDQGISIKNPDTHLFIRYRVAGAYDSNIALLVTYGDSRERSFVRLSEILRCTSLRGRDLATNLEFHYGLVHWFLARDVWAKPTTGFVVPYLTQVGLLAKEVQAVDFGALWIEIAARYTALAQQTGADAVEAMDQALKLKHTMITRPLRWLCGEPHILSAWLSRNLYSFERRGGRVAWTRNPLEVIEDTYWLLHMEHRDHSPAAHVIWDHDHEVLQRGLDFYRTLSAKLAEGKGTPSWTALCELLDSEKPPPGFDAGTWSRIRSAHLGYCAGTELLLGLIELAERAKFFEMGVAPDGDVAIPERLRDKELQEQAIKVLAPPPAMSSDTIVAMTGGMFYAQESPDRPPFVEKGSHFHAGDPLYIVEVMKMFNKVLAPFAGTVDQILVEGGEGTIVSKGQPLFKVTPDEPIEVEDEEVVAARRKEQAKGLADVLFGAGWRPGG